MLGFGDWVFGLLSVELCQNFGIWGGELRVTALNPRRPKPYLEGQGDLVSI